MKKTFIWTALATLLCTGFYVPANAETVVVDPGTRAILDNAVLNNSCGSDLCAPVLDPCMNTCAPAQVITTPVVEAAPVCGVAAPACGAPVIETRRSHFLRFGLGPILDFGLF
jgi:hypothetical protein